MAQDMEPRPLSSAESNLLRFLLTRHMHPGVTVADVDLSAALVSRYDESECLRFLEPVASDEPGSASGFCIFEDRDGVPITAFLTVDPEGKLRELDLWKADDTAIIELPDSYS